MTFQEELSAYTERSSSLIEGAPQMDEQNTKRKIIEPLVKLLGWEILSSEVELEYSVQMGSGTKKADYALKIDETPVVFIETKGCDTEISKKHRDQLRSYMRQVGVDWGLLSNGREFEIFRRDTSAVRPNEISLAHFPLDEVEVNRQALKALSKESITTGESERIAERIESVKSAVSELQANKERVAKDVTNLVTKVVGESVSQTVEHDAKDFVDDLIESLNDQVTRSAGKKKPKPVSEPADQANYTIQISRNGSDIHTITGQNQSDAMANLVDYLIEERNLLDEIDIPYIPGTGKGVRALINDVPRHTSGEKMKSYHELTTGYYLFTSLSSKSKMRYISELVEKVGLECEFGDNW